MQPPYHDQQEAQARLEEQQRNLQALPQFFSSDLDVVPVLPVELVNEPYSFYDNGSRLEITRRRPKFLFKIDINSVSCTVGSRTFRKLNLRRAVGIIGGVPQKEESNISVIAVYDTYGLGVAYTYLRHLYYHKYNADNPFWLVIYLIGSLVVLQPGLNPDMNSASPYYTLFLCSQIMRELEKLESQQPKMLGTLETVPEGTLPEDVLSRIISSRRVSKTIAADIQGRVCGEIPTMGELWEANGTLIDYQTTLQLEDGTYIIRGLEEEGIEERTLHRDRNTFIMTYTLGARDRDLSRSRVVIFSLGVYSSAFEAVGCDPEVSIDSMLRKIARETHLTAANLDSICGWILQLSYEFGQNMENRTFRSIYDLGEELDRLIEVALYHYEH
jgi:hypothetical protein